MDPTQFKVCWECKTDDMYRSQENDACGGNIAMSRHQMQVVRDLNDGVCVF